MIASFGSSALLRAQQPAPVGEPTFTVASIEPMDGPEVDGAVPLGTALAALMGHVRVEPGDRFDATTSLRQLIEFAYGVDQRWDRSKGTDPLLDQWFSVSAQGATGSFDAATDDGLPPVRHMVRQLLQDKFKLAVSFDEETRRAMVLRRSSSGAVAAKLQRVPGGCVDGSQAEADARGLARCNWNQQGSKIKAVIKDFDQFAARISRLSRQDVVNETGLIGAFTFETAFDPSTVIRVPPVPADGRLEPAVARLLYAQPQYPYERSFEAAMKDDLDLTISYEPRAAPVLVITHVEPLREN